MRSEQAGHVCLLLAEHCYHVLYGPVPQLCSNSFNIYIHPKQVKIEYLFQDLHGKYFSRLSALDLPNLKNLSKDIS